MSISKMKYPGPLSMEYRHFARIAATGKGYPAQVLTNDDIIKRFNLMATDRAVRYSVGIEERRIARPDELSSDLLYQAAAECFSRCDVQPGQIDRIIYAKMLGDHCFPATSLQLLKKLGVRRGIPCMDIASACSGFIHALDMALRYINAGEDYILVMGGVKSPFGMELNLPPDTTTVFLPGDAVAGCIVEKSATRHFLASYLYTDSSYYDYSTMEFGSRYLNARDFKAEPMVFSMEMPSGSVVHQAILDTSKIVVDNLLREAGLTIGDIDIFATSDQTTMAWKEQCRVLGITEEKSISLFSKLGNTVAAMAPLNLNGLVENGKLKRGMTVLLTAHGAGASGGGFIFTY